MTTTLQEKLEKKMTEGWEAARYGIHAKLGEAPKKRRGSKKAEAEV